MDANILPPPTGQIVGRKLSGSGMLLVLLLGLTGLYATARMVDTVDRIHFISKIENGDFTREINTGTLTRLQFAEKAHAIDSRDSMFVTLSWVVTIVLFLGYRNWFRHFPRRRLSPDKRWMSKLTGFLWIVILGTQFIRFAMNNNGLDGIKMSSYVNLVSRGLIIPAVILSYFIVRERERMPEPTTAV